MKTRSAQEVAKMTSKKGKIAKGSRKAKTLKNENKMIKCIEVF